MTTKKAPPPASPILNLETMTVDEAIWFEEASGLALDEVFNAKGEIVASKMRVLKGATYVALKQANPNATIADAGATTLKATAETVAGRPPMSPSDGD